MELLLTGRWLDAHEAHKWGFVNEIVEPENLLARAYELANLISSGPPLVIGAIKQVVREAEDTNFQDMLNRVTKRQVETVDKLYGSEDLHEGQLAFTEKREPRWKGK